MSDLSTNNFPLLSALKIADRVTLTDSTTGQQFAAMEIGRFLEELIRLLPESSLTSKGLMSIQDKQSNPSSPVIKRYIFSASILSKKAFRLKFSQTRFNASLFVKIYGDWDSDVALGSIKKVFGFNFQGGNINQPDYSVVDCTTKICSTFYITHPATTGEYAYIDVVNKSSIGANLCTILVEIMGASCTGIVNQVPADENLKKNNRDECLFQLKSSPAAVSTYSSAVESIDIESITPPPPANCVPPAQEQPFAENFSTPANEKTQQEFSESKTNPLPETGKEVHKM